MGSLARDSQVGCGAVWPASSSECHPSGSLPKIDGSIVLARWLRHGRATQHAPFLGRPRSAKNKAVSMSNDQEYVETHYTVKIVAESPDGDKMPATITARVRINQNLEAQAVRRAVRDGAGGRRPADQRRALHRLRHAGPGRAAPSRRPCSAGPPPGARPRTSRPAGPSLTGPTGACPTPAGCRRAAPHRQRGPAGPALRRPPLHRPGVGGPAAPQRRAGVPGHLIVDSAESSRHWETAS